MGVSFVMILVDGAGFKIIHDGVIEISVGLVDIMEGTVTDNQVDLSHGEFSGSFIIVVYVDRLP